MLSLWDEPAPTWRERVQQRYQDLKSRHQDLKRLVFARFAAMWDWWSLLVPGAIIIAVAVVFARWAEHQSATGFSTGMLTAATGLLTAETFLATLGLTFGRAETYRRAIDYLRTEDARLEKLSAIGGSVSLEHLARDVAWPAYYKALLLREALDPANPPRISRQGYRKVIQRAADREQKKKAEQQRQYELRQYGKERPADRQLSPSSWAIRREDSRWTEDVLIHTRAAEARIALICYLAAGVPALSILAGSGASWQWTTQPAAEFFALLAVSAAALCVCVMALLARHEAMAEMRDLLHKSALPTVDLMFTWNMSYITPKRETAEGIVARSPDSRFARILLAAVLLDYPSAVDRGQASDNWRKDPWEERLLPPSPEAARRDVQASCDLLTPMVKRRTDEDVEADAWVWGSPDVTAALLRARAGELLDEPQSELDELSYQAATKLAYRVPAIGSPGTSDVFDHRYYLLPQGWVGSVIGPLPAGWKRDLFSPQPPAGWPTSPRVPDSQSPTLNAEHPLTPSDAGQPVRGSRERIAPIERDGKDHSWADSGPMVLDGHAELEDSSLGPGASTSRWQSIKEPPLPPRRGRITTTVEVRDLLKQALTKHSSGYLNSVRLQPGSGESLTVTLANPGDWTAALAELKAAGLAVIGDSTPGRLTLTVLGVNQ